MCVCHVVQHCCQLTCCSRCRPVSAPYWYGLYLIGSLVLLLTVILIIILFFSKSEETLSQMCGNRCCLCIDRVGLALMSLCFFVAWGFGLPATRPIGLAYTRLLFQLIFLVACVLSGVLMLLLVLLRSSRVRAALCCCCSSRFKGEDITRLQFVNELSEDVVGKDNVYSMSSKGPDTGLMYSNEVMLYEHNLLDDNLEKSDEKKLTDTTQL